MIASILFHLNLKFDKVGAITELCRRKRHCFCQHGNTMVNCRNISLGLVNASTLPPATQELTIQDLYGEFTDGALNGLQASLVRLFIYRSQLKAVPVGLLSSLPILVHLDLRGKNIAQIPPFAFEQNRWLRKLILINNKVAPVSA